MKWSQHDLKVFATCLRAQQKQLVQSLEELKKSSKPIAPDNAIGRISRLEAIADQQMAIESQKRLSQKLTRTQSALLRLQSDPASFGQCITCEVPLSDKRLMISPESVQCVECASRRID